MAHGTEEHDDSSVSRRGMLAAASVIGAVGAASLASTACSQPVSTEHASLIEAGRAVTPEAFGAVADGKTDCTEAFKASVRAATKNNYIAGRQRNRPIVLSAGVYLLSDTITITGADIILSGPGGQNCALLFDHLSGDGIAYTGPGDSQFRGFSIDASERRTAKGNGRGFASLPVTSLLGKASSTIRLTLVDLVVQRQPGDGIALFNPEGGRLANVTSNNNRGSGCVIDCSAFENICNGLDFCRFRDNGRYGLRVDSVDNSIFQRVECLNNRGPAQFSIKGNYNTILCADCECFDILDALTPRVGLALSGRGNVVQGGVFYKLSTAIALTSANDNRVILPKLEGGRNLPMQVGIDLARDCARNAIDMIEGNFIAAPVRDAGRINRVMIGGRDAAPGLNKPAAAADGRFIPDLAGGRLIQVTALGPCMIMPPSNAAAGDVFTLVIDSGTQGIGAIRFAEPYRGWSEQFTAMAKRRYATAAFVVAEDGRCLPQSLVGYD